MADHGIGRRKFTERELERRLHARVEASLACAAAIMSVRGAIREEVAE